MNINSYLKTIQIVAFAIMSSVIIMAVGMYYAAQNMSYDSEQEEMGIIFLIIGGILLLGAFAFTRFIRGKIIKANQNSSLKKKLMSYRILVILNLASFEGVGIISAVFMYMSGRQELLFVITATLLFMLISFPNKMRLKTAMQITDRELMEGLD